MAKRSKSGMWEFFDIDILDHAIAVYNITDCHAKSQQVCCGPQCTQKKDYYMKGMFLLEFGRTEKCDWDEIEMRL